MFPALWVLQPCGDLCVLVIGVTWLITLGGGGSKNRWSIWGTLIYQGVRLERGARLVRTSSYYTHTLFRHFHLKFLFAPLQLSSQKKLSLSIKSIWGGTFTPFPPQVTPMVLVVLKVFFWPPRQASLAVITVRTSTSYLLAVNDKGSLTA
jgi:hypothetical protein